MKQAIPVFSYRFKVHVDGITKDDSAVEYFSSIEGLSKSSGRSLALNYVSGSNSLAFLPEGCITKTIILRRPLMNQSSAISKWCETSIHSMSYTPRVMYVFVINVEEEVVAQWTAYNSIPISVEISPMDIRTGNTLIEQCVCIKAEKITMDKLI